MRVISADALIMQQISDGVYIVNREAILNAPTFDAEPIRHGRWIYDETGANYCSECNEYPYDDGEYHLVWHTDYCPNCGAKMDEVSE